MTVPGDVVYGSEQFRDWLVALKERAMLGSTNQRYAMLRAVLEEVRDQPPPDGIVGDVLAVLAQRTPPNILPILSEHMPPQLRAAWRAAVTSACPDPAPR